MTGLKVKSQKSKVRSKAEATQKFSAKRNRTAEALGPAVR